MAKKIISDSELSLFDDSFFESPTTPEEQPSTMLCPAKEEGRADATPLPAKASKPLVVDDHLRMRSKRQRLRVTFPDGEVVSDVSATTTMVRAIERIGVERVAALGMECCHVALVSNEVTRRYAEWTKEIQPGWYLMAQSNTDQKYLQLKSIVKQLALDVKVELGDFETIQSVSNEHRSTSRKKKTQLKVVFPNGTVIFAHEAQQTFQRVVEMVGIDKIKRTHLSIGSKPIVTPIQQFHSQVRLSTGEWLTIPAQTKDKYKILRVLSSMTHTPFDVSLVER